MTLFLPLVLDESRHPYPDGSLDSDLAGAEIFVDSSYQSFALSVTAGAMFLVSVDFFAPRTMVSCCPIQR